MTMRKPLAAAAIAAGSVAAAFGAVGASWSDTRVPSPEQARVLQALNARRKAAGARPLEWDPVAASVLLEVFRDTKRPDEKTVDSRLERGQGFNAGWTWSSRGVRDPVEAADEADAELLSREYTHAAVAAFDDLGVAGMQRVVVLAIRVPPLFGRRVANGPAGSYRFRCPSCRREFVYHMGSPRGHSSMDCPSCKTLLLPYLEDTRDALHWPTWYVTPFAPFATTNPFLAWQWVNQKVRYDHPKADHDLSGWQTPQETNEKGTGVCRDTAVFLAAWLRHDGKDVRVVTGLLNGEHHAWAVVKDGETRYLFESAIDGNMSRRYPPRLELATNYYPTEMQFDDTRVWLNRGQQQTRDYDSPGIWFATEEVP